MSTISRVFLGLGAVALLSATVLGAFASHALDAQTAAATRRALEAAIDYQFYHGLGLIAVAMLTERSPGVVAFRLAGWLLIAGIVLFCGGIYAPSLGAPAALGLATPVGGIAFLAGWLAVALGAWTAGRTGRADPLA